MGSTGRSPSSWHADCNGWRAVIPRLPRPSGGRRRAADTSSDEGPAGLPSNRPDRLLDPPARGALPMGATDPSAAGIALALAVLTAAWMLALRQWGERRR